MGLRLEETLSLQISDIDAERKLVHIRRGKGHKDRFVPLPELTLKALRTLWLKHRHPACYFLTRLVLLNIFNRQPLTWTEVVGKAQ